MLKTPVEHVCHHPHAVVTIWRLLVTGQLSIFGNITILSNKLLISLKNVQIMHGD